jgi:heavy metal translocating P-type ATPase
MTAPACGCAHCGLPLPRRPVHVVLDGRSEACCCSGCVLALTVTRARGDAGAASAILVRLGLAVFFAMNVMMVTMPTYAAAVYGGASADGPLFAVLRLLGVLLATPVLLLLGGPVVAGAIANRAAGFGVDALVALGTAAAYGLSAASVLRGGSESYVDTACMLLVLVTLGRYLEAQAKARAGAIVRGALGPEALVARRVGTDGIHEEIAVSALAPGDRLVVGPGGTFPTDGIVEHGVGGVDESMLTGEPGPRLRQPGDTVAGGTCSIDGRFVVRAVAPHAESAAARLATMLQAALAERTAVERIADRAAAVLGPLTVAIALGAGAWWAIHGGPGRGVMVALAVLVVACPCALGIATPAAIWTAISAAATRGVIVRGAPVLERLARVRRVLFDKTGTLTDPGPRLEAVETLPDAGLPAAEILRFAAALEAEANHPLAQAIARAAGSDPARAPRVDALRVLPGLGVTGRVGGHAVGVGSGRWAKDQGFHAGPDDGVTWVAIDGRAAARLRLGETVEASAGRALRALRADGYAVGLITGAARADAVVPRLVAPGEAACGLLPGDKLAYVRRARQDAVVAMVGDGLNDAPALAAADVGIAVGRATDLARIAADVVLLGRSVDAVPWLLRHARRTLRIARQNLVWAFAYNMVALAMAAAGMLTPVLAATAMLASSATVIANSRRLAKVGGARSARGRDEAISQCLQPGRAGGRPALPAGRDGERLLV